MYTNIFADKLINLIISILNTDCVYTNLKREVTNFSSVILNEKCYQPIPVAARPKAWVCSRSLAGIEDSNPP
jgi:hypothetical protein